jgi:carbonic anhydrase
MNTSPQNEPGPAPLPTPRYNQSSPLDFRETLYHPFDLGQLEFTYPLSKVTGTVEGEGVHAKVELVNPVRIPLFGMQLKLEQLHFHAPSEHLVSGVSWPLELHLLHRIEGGQTGMTVKSDKLVIGVFFLGSADAASGSALSHFGKSFVTAREKRLASADSPAEIIEFNPNHCLPPIDQRSQFFRYEGSLTSGNYDETVSWLVFERPVAVLDADIAAILKAAEQQPRPPQELNRRAVLRSFA